MNSVQDHLPVTTHESGIDAVSLAQELIRIDTCQSGVGDVEALRLLGRFVEAAGASWELFWDDGVAAGMLPGGAPVRHAWRYAVTSTPCRPTRRAGRAHRCPGRWNEASSTGAARAT